MYFPYIYGNFPEIEQIIFLVNCLETGYVTGQNDRQTQILSGEIVILARHCPVTGRYFEPYSGLVCPVNLKINYKVQCICERLHAGNYMGC